MGAWARGLGKGNMAVEGLRSEAIEWAEYEIKRYSLALKPHGLTIRWFPMTRIAPYG